MNLELLDPPIRVCCTIEKKESTEREKIYTRLWFAGNYQSLDILRCGLQFNFVIIDLTEQETGDKVNKLTDQRSSTDRKSSHVLQALLIDLEVREINTWRNVCSTMVVLAISSQDALLIIIFNQVQDVCFKIRYLNCIVR